MSSWSNAVLMTSNVINSYQVSLAASSIPHVKKDLTNQSQVFLRILEYYEGILFLTTNRVEDIDAAFQSRIHISLAYEGLSVSSRRHVWSNFLNASSSSDSKTHAFSDEDLDELALHPMNGREIKNVLKTAKLLANKRGMELGIKHVKTVLAIENRHVKNSEENGS